MELICKNLRVNLFFFKGILLVYFINNLIHISETVDLLEECSNTDDDHVTRGSFTCCSASPRHLPLQSPFDFRSIWRRCAVEPKSPNEDPVISAWRVYRCIVFSGLRGKPLRPSTFTQLFTAKYPGTMKSQILSQMSELEDEDAKFEVDVECLKRTPYPKVTLIRNLFYEVEQEICEGSSSKERKIDSRILLPELRNKSSVKLIDIFRKSSTYSTTDFAEVLCEPCDRRKEMYHRNGDCCSLVSLPFPFIYLPFRYGNHERVKQCAEDLVDDVGLPSDTEFSSKLQYLCYSSCEHYLSGTITENDIWAGIRLLQNERDLKAIAIKMIPKYFSRKYKQDVLDYTLENFLSAWTETKTFESELKLGQRDVRNVEKEKLKTLLISCKSHRLIETVINLYLNTLCLEQYEESTLEKHGFSYTTPRFPIGFDNFSFSSHPHNSKDGIKDVILNLDWNPEEKESPSSHHQQHDYGKGIQFDVSNTEDDFLPPNFRNNSSDSFFKRQQMRPSVYKNKKN